VVQPLFSYSGHWRGVLPEAIAVGLMAPSRRSPTAASPRCWRSCGTRARAAEHPRDGGQPGEHFQGV